MSVRDREKSLISAATLAVRPEFRDELEAHLRAVHSSGSATYEELYEIFLQTYLFAGFPAALECVRLLERVFGKFPDSSHEMMPSDVIASYSEYYEKGDALYKQVYGEKAARVRSELLRLSPELASWALLEGYGKTLSRSGVDSRVRELCIVAQLVQLGWERQLYSHLLGARNVGASIEDILEAARIGSHGNPDRLIIAEQLIKKLV